MKSGGLQTHSPYSGKGDCAHCMAQISLQPLLGVIVLPEELCLTWYF